MLYTVHPQQMQRWDTCISPSADLTSSNRVRHSYCKTNTYYPQEMWLKSARKPTQSPGNTGFAVACLSLPNTKPATSTEKSHHLRVVTQNGLALRRWIPGNVYVRLFCLLKHPDISGVISVLVTPFHVSLLASFVFIVKSDLRRLPNKLNCCGCNRKDWYSWINM